MSLGDDPTPMPWQYVMAAKLANDGNMVGTTICVNYETRETAVFLKVTRPDGMSHMVWNNLNLNQAILIQKALADAIDVMKGLKPSRGVLQGGEQ